MEELQEVRRRRMSFKLQQQFPTVKNDKFEHRGWSKANEEMGGRRNTHHYPSCYDSLDIPMHAMEFLCRSWNPTSSNFLHIFSSANEKHSLKEQEGKVDHDSDILEEEEEMIQVTNDAKPYQVQINYGNIESQPNKTWTRILERSIPSFTQSCISPGINKGIKMWLRENSVTEMFIKWRRGEKKKKKDEFRFQTARIHAALSVTQLAAAVAGFAATNMEMAKEDVKMSNIVAYSAALLASACAEAAESVGAGKAHVASAVSSGLAVQSPADMITLTAATATSLRGAETLKSRVMCNLQFPGKKEPVKLSAKLPIINPSGERVIRLVSIQTKHKQLILILRKKYFGVLAASKEYRIEQLKEERKAQGYYLLAIKCNDGNIKLLFEDRDQLHVWMSNISSLLEM